MSEENKGGLFSQKRESIFSKHSPSKGLFEKPDPQEAPAEAPSARPSKNPFATGTDETPPQDNVPEKPEETEAASPEETGAEADRNKASTGAQDAFVKLIVAPDSMTAAIVVDPPREGGQHLTRDMLDAALSKAKIVYGIQEEGLQRLLLPTYDTSIEVALGTPAVDGENGVCKELYARVREAKITEKEDGSVDYKELGLICDLPAGTVICELTLPTDGQNGTNIQGRELKARAGKKAVPPIGEGTRLSEDGLKVTTTVTGNLVFRNGRFTVDEVFRVQDVDYDVGNIHFSGDVVVQGEIQDGFEIRAGGNISLHGRVGSVVLDAKGNINIEQGINGTGKAEITAAKNVNAGFIENCLVRAGGNIVAGSIINSTVECEGDIDVTSKHGTIVGGKITAFGSIKAKEIGNESNTPTLVTVGITPRLLKERKKLQDQLADVTKYIDEMTKNTLYIEKLMEQQREIPQDRIQLLQRTKVALPITEKKKEQLEATLKEVEEKIESSTGSTITARIIYPPTRITIGKLSMSLNEVRNSARVYISQQGELTVGSS